MAAPERIILFHSNGVKQGEIIMMENGYYQFWPEMRPGYWPTYELKKIIERVDALNKDWDEQVAKDLERS